jgi:AraC-like DNA-binding protein
MSGGGDSWSVADLRYVRLMRVPMRGAGTVNVVEPVMEQRVGLATVPLGRFVHRYRFYSYTGFPVGVSHAVPSRHLTVMISLGDPITVVGSRPESFLAFAAGLQTASAKVVDQGVGCGVAIDLTPAGARALLGLPASVIAGQVVDLGQIWGARAGELGDRLANAAGWNARLVVLDRFLLRTLSEAADPLGAVSAAWDHLVASAGNTPVGVVAGRVGLSRRHLSGQFRAEYGVSPKQAGRVFRFERAANLLRRPRCPSLAETATSCGFFDQAHLAREWQALAGMTPTEWLATESKDPVDETSDRLSPVV